ncbi:MAG: TonB-dependent receptor [Nitrospira sp.]|nr:TonB-dependent receptor [Nitrospira sp.]
MLTFRETHQISYGMDYGEVKIKSGEEWPYLYPIWIEESQYTSTSKAFIFHIYDRWTISKAFTLDAGLFLTYYSARADYHSQDTLFGPFDTTFYNENKFNINPRVGIALDLWKKATFRLAYQRRSTTAFLGELAPVGTSGLTPPTFDIAFNAAQDLQGSIEYELTEKTFLKGLLGYERLSDLVTTGGDKRAQLWYGRVSINQILSRFFSFSLRYHYNDSMYLDHSGRKLRGIPQNSGDARLVFVHPSEIYLWLRESYIGERYADTDNTIKLKGYFLTDFYAQKEMMKKRILLSFSVQNIFNTKYETISHPYWWHFGALPGKGTTISLRIEYRL